MIGDSGNVQPITGGSFNPQKFVDDVMAGAQPVADEFLSGLVTAADLQRKEFPPIKYVVPGFVPEGLSILAGKPKRGKSWMALDWGLAVAHGGVAFGNINCAGGDVLYLALEDNERRLQSRMQQLAGDVNDWPSRLHMKTDWPRLSAGGLDYIRRWIETSESPRLINIDTLQKVRDPRPGQQGHYEYDYAAVAPLQELAGEMQIAVVAVHHLKKGAEQDPLDLVSGSTGLTGAADTVLVLDRDENGTTLYVRGRDIEEAEHALTFDKISGRWAVLGDADEVRRSEERNKVLAVLRDEGKAMGPKDIAEATGLSYAGIRQLCPRMVHAGLLDKDGRGLYRAL